MIVFVKVLPIGNKFVLEDNEGNNILRKFVDTKEEAEKLAQQIRYVYIDDDDDEDEEEGLGKGMFWEWWNDLCKISGGDNGLALIYFFDKVYKPRNDNLEDYLDRIRNLKYE